MKKYFFLLFISIASFAASARHSVSGIVTGYRDSAVAGVTVYIPEFEKTDETKAGGTYIIRNIGKGRVHIQFSKQGYRTIVQMINTDDSALVLNVKMEPVLTEPNEFTSLSGNPSLVEKVPFTVNSFSAVTYRQTGAIGLMQAMALQPGIDRMSVGNGISKPVIRGMSLSHVQVREYGTKIADEPWNELHDIGISENGVDHVEIIKGPAALLYGADAMGGVLIFEEQKPAAAGTILGDVGLGIHSNPIGLEGELGFKGATTSGIFYSVRGGVMSHTSYIQGQEADEVKKNTEAKAFAPNSKWGNESAKISVGLSKSWGVSKLTYSLYHQTIGLIQKMQDDGQYANSEETDKQRDRSYYAPYQDVSRNLVSSENTIITGKSKVNVTIAYQHTTRDEFEENFFTQNEDDKKLSNSNALSTFTYDVRWTSNPEKKFGIAAGSQGLMQTNDLERSASLALYSHEKSNYGGYILLRYDLEKINLLGGVRYDLYSEEFNLALQPNTSILEKDLTPVNGSLGLSYHPLNDLTIKLNGATGYTTPNEMQLDTTRFTPDPNHMIIHAVDLKTTMNMQGDLGISYMSKHVDASLSFFYNQVNDFIYQQYTGLKDTVTDSLQHIYDIYKYAQKDAVLSGGEVTVDIHPASFKWIELQLGYATVNGKFGGGDNVPYIPADKFTAALTLHSQKLKWFYKPYVTIAASYYGDQKDTAYFELASESYTLLDLRIGLQLPFAHQVVDVNLAMTNILNTPYMSHLSQVQDISIRDMGRNVSLKIRIPFGVKGFSR